MFNQTPYLELTPPNEGAYFFQALWGRIKFSIVFLLMMVSFAALLWNLQPWLKIEVNWVKNSSPSVTTR